MSGTAAYSKKTMAQNLLISESLKFQPKTTCTSINTTASQSLFRSHLFPQTFVRSFFLEFMQMALVWGLRGTEIWYVIIACHWYDAVKPRDQKPYESTCMKEQTETLQHLGQRPPAGPNNTCIRCGLGLRSCVYNMTENKGYTEHRIHVVFSLTWLLFIRYFIFWLKITGGFELSGLRNTYRYLQT